MRCNVIVDLKVHEFRHEDQGQLNAYVGYYKMNEMAALKDLSERDIEFLIAITKDDQVSKASDMIERLNMSNANYQQYKNRLRDARVIDQELRGVIMITVPRMKEYLRRKYGEE